MKYTLGTHEHQFIDSFGFYSDGIYCSVTGKMFGSLHNDEYREVVETCNDLADLEQRILASMRPSMKWNRLARLESLDEMRKSHPVETMAYLLNRLFLPAKDSKQSADWRTINRNRILLFAHLESHHQLASTAEVRNSAWDMNLLMLLELESKLSLITEIPSFHCSDLLSVKSEDVMIQLQLLLTPFHARRIAFHTQAESDAKFFASNPGARKAFYQQWMEVDPTPAQIVKQEKQKNVNLFDAIFQELAGNASHKPSAQRVQDVELTQAKDVIRPSTKMPMIFGVKAVQS